MLSDFSKNEFDIIIQAGQSNAEGCGQGPVQTPFVQTPKICYMNRGIGPQANANGPGIRGFLTDSDLIIHPAGERVWGNAAIADFSLPFAAEYLSSVSASNTKRDVLIIRAAVGGTGFSDHRWGMEDDLYRNMLEMVLTALSLNRQNKPVAFLWHQGETDAYLGAGYTAHYRNLMKLAESVRKILRVPDLPFIAGDFVHHWEDQNKAICDPVVDAIRAVCRDLPGAGFVETSDLSSNDQEVHNSDIIHFSRKSLYELGLRYYRLFHELQSKRVK